MSSKHQAAVLDTGGCPCESTDLCRIQNFSRQKEVTVVTEGKTDFKKWAWEGIHNVINAAKTDNSKLMCYAHSKKSNYGILEKIPSNDTITKTELDTWMNNVIQRANKIYADFIVVDLLDLVGNCFMSLEHGERVINLTKGFAKKVKLIENRQLACVLPWKPPCFQGECKVTSELNLLCDVIMTSPESYFTECDAHCRAKATMPTSNLIIGTDEYLYKEDILASKFVIGIPWHGYDYKCSDYEGYTGNGITSLCKIKTKPNSLHCDFESSRTKMTFYELEKQYPDKYEKHHVWSKLYNSFYFDVNVNKSGNSGYHQIWYESDESLFEKYKFALDMKLRGVVIWTVDDLLNYDQGDAREWNWLMHTMMVTGEYDNGENLHRALKAMAIGVGCFIGGTIVGAIITTLIARRQMRLLNRRYKPPFHKDEEEDETANFHEDDKYL